MMMTLLRFCLCHHRGGERVRGNTQVPGSRSSHGTPGLSPKGRQTHRSTTTRSQAGDLAGKYGVQAPAKDFEATLLGPNPPRSESKCPVERPPSCDTGHNAPLATKGTVQQSSVNRPVYSEHVAVTPGPGSSFMTGTQYPVSGTRFQRPLPVNRVLRPHRVHRSHWVIRSHRVIRSDQFTLVRKLKRIRPTSVWTSLSFLFLIHRTDRYN